MKIRSAMESDSIGIARVSVESWQHTYRGIISNDFLDSLSWKERSENWNEVLKSPLYFCFVAENESKEIVGFASGGKTRENLRFPRNYDSELYAIYLLEPYQGKGLGSVLVLSLCEKLLENQFQSMIVCVLTQNPFRSFYEKIGGLKVADSDITIGKVSYPTIIYGWQDLKTLIERLKR